MCVEFDEFISGYRQYMLASVADHVRLLEGFLLNGAGESREEFVERLRNGATFMDALAHYDCLLKSGAVPTTVLSPNTMQ
jgi:hypothetical protein